MRGVQVGAFIPAHLQWVPSWPSVKNAGSETQKDGPWSLNYPLVH